MFSRMGFRTKLSLSMIAVLLLFAALLALVVSRTASSALVEESKKRGTSSALHVAARIAEPLLAQDYLRMQELLNEVTRTGEDVAFLFVVNAQGRPLAHTFSGGFPIGLLEANGVESGAACSVRLLSTGSELIYDFAVPVAIGVERLGTVRLGLSHQKVSEALRRLLLAILITMGFAVLIAALAGALFARTVTRRIARLHRSAEQIVKGNLDIETLPAPRLRCWEFMDCERTQCPAYGNYRHRCWFVGGTLCPWCGEGDFARKIDSCRSCTVYRMGTGDEIQSLAEFFDVMALTLRDRLGDLERTQRDLQEQQQLFRTILDVTPDLVSLQSPTLQLLAANKATAAFSAGRGLPAGALRGGAAALRGGGAGAGRRQAGARDRRRHRVREGTAGGGRRAVAPRGEDPRDGPRGRPHGAALQREGHHGVQEVPGADRAVAEARIARAARGRCRPRAQHPARHHSRLRAAHASGFSARLGAARDAAHRGEALEDL